jgi:type IV pilus assembly protein PilE
MATQKEAGTRQNRETGVTLIELMLVVALIAVLAAFAYPTYTDYVRRTRRINCESTMVSTAALLERKHSVTNQYSTTGLPLPNQCPQEGTKFYDLTYTVTAENFTITATPVAAQSGDGCGKLSLTHTGTKNADGGVSECW